MTQKNNLALKVDVIENNTGFGGDLKFIDCIIFLPTQDVKEFKKKFNLMHTEYFNQWYIPWKEKPQPVYLTDQQMKILKSLKWSWLCDLKEKPQAIKTA